MVGFIDYTADYCASDCCGMSAFLAPVLQPSDVAFYIEFNNFEVLTIDMVGNNGYIGAIPLTDFDYVIAYDTNGHKYNYFRLKNSYVLTCRNFNLRILLSDGIGAFSTATRGFEVIDPLCNKSDYLRIKSEYSKNDCFIYENEYVQNGIYYGVPQNSISGDANLLVSNEMLIYGTLRRLGAEMELSEFNSTVVSKSVKTGLYNIALYNVPDWFVIQIENILQRGEVYVNNEFYLVSEAQKRIFEAIRGENQCRSNGNIALKKEYCTTYNCKTDLVGCQFNLTATCITVATRLTPNAIRLLYDVISPYSPTIRVLRVRLGSLADATALYNGVNNCSSEIAVWFNTSPNPTIIGLYTKHIIFVSAPVFTGGSWRMDIGYDYSAYTFSPCISVADPIEPLVVPTIYNQSATINAPANSTNNQVWCLTKYIDLSTGLNEAVCGATTWVVPLGLTYTFPNAPNTQTIRIPLGKATNFTNGTILAINGIWTKTYNVVQ